MASSIVDGEKSESINMSEKSAVSPSVEEPCSGSDNSESQSEALCVVENMKEENKEVSGVSEALAEVKLSEESSVSTSLAVEDQPIENKNSVVEPIDNKSLNDKAAEKEVKDVSQLKSEKNDEEIENHAEPNQDDNVNHDNEPNHDDNADDDDDFDGSESDDEYLSGEDGSEDGSYTGSQVSGSRGSFEDYSEGEGKGEPGIGESRHRGDGEEEEVEGGGPTGQTEMGDEPHVVDDDEDKQNPAYVPRRGTYYEHDMRGANDDGTSGAEPETGKKDEKGKKLWKDDQKWLHDKYDARSMGPKSREEIIATYGYDIREYGPDEPIRGGFGGRGPRGRGGSRGSRRLGDFMKSDDRDGLHDKDRYDAGRSYSDGEEERNGIRVAVKSKSEPREQPSQSRTAEWVERGGGDADRGRGRGGQRSERSRYDNGSKINQGSRYENRGYEEFRTGPRGDGDKGSRSNRGHDDGGSRSHRGGYRSERDFDASRSGRGGSRADRRDEEGDQRSGRGRYDKQRREDEHVQHHARTIQNSNRYNQQEKERYNQQDNQRYNQDNQKYNQQDNQRYNQQDNQRYNQQNNNRYNQDNDRYNQQNSQRHNQPEAQSHRYSDTHRQRGRRTEIIVTGNRSQDARYDNGEVNRPDVNEVNRSGGWGSWRGEGENNTERRQTVVVVNTGGVAPEIMPPMTRALTARPADRPVTSEARGGWVGGEFTPSWQQNPQESEGVGRGSKRYSSQRQRPIEGGQEDRRPGGLEDRGPRPAPAAPLVQHVRPQAVSPQAVPSPPRGQQQQQQPQQSQPVPGTAAVNAQYYDASGAGGIISSFPPPPMLPYPLPSTLPYHPAAPNIRLYSTGGSNPPPGLVLPYPLPPPHHYINTPPPSHQMMYAAPPTGYPLPPASDPAVLAAVSEAPAPLYYSSVPPRAGPPPGLPGATFYPGGGAPPRSPYPTTVENQSGARARSPPRRVKAAIPIINPQDVVIEGGGVGGGMVAGMGRQLRGTYTSEPTEPLSYAYHPLPQQQQQHQHHHAPSE